MCKCGCNSCETESTALVLKESKFVHTPISEGLKYHIDNKIPLSENIYRIGSKEYMKLYSEARSLYSRGKLDVSENDKYFLTETHVGSFGMFEGKRVPLDIPMLNEEEDLTLKDTLNKNREQIILDFGPKTFRVLQIQLMKDDEAFVKDFLVTKGYMEKEELPFEESLNEVSDEELKREYNNILSREYELTNLYTNDRSEENWNNLSQIRTKGKNLERKLEKLGLLDLPGFKAESRPSDTVKLSEDRTEDLLSKILNAILSQGKGDNDREKDLENLDVSIDQLTSAVTGKNALELDIDQDLFGRLAKIDKSKLKEIIKEKLCKKGEAYRKRRMAAGEKSSAYLSGRAVKVCKGQMSGKKKKKANENTAPNHNGKAAPYGSGYKKLDIDKITESLRDWFKKENWVRINTSGNISGDCGTMKKGKATTRCLPKKKAQSMTKAERKATVAKKVRGSKKGKQFVSVNENFEMGDRVKLTPDYEETPGEVFTITQISGNKYFIADEDGRGWYTYGDQLVMADDEYINEAKKKKKKEKKDPPIGKPKRGGSKAYYVYVRDPKTKKVKKVSFGSGGLRAKIRNPKARKAFAARHNCKNKKDRTKAGYWSCNLPRYAPQLGLGAKMNTFW
jgi:hypothetical protein